MIDWLLVIFVTLVTWVLLLSKINMVIAIPLIIFLIFVFTLLGEYFFRNIVKQVYNLLDFIGMLPDLSKHEDTVKSLSSGMTFKEMLSWAKLI